MNIAPQRLPAQFCDTRIQHELFSSRLPSRSQWNCTFTRPCLSTHSSSPFLPTTTAVCTPWMIGRGVTRAGRYGTVNGIAVTLLRYRASSASSRGT